MYTLMDEYDLDLQGFEDEVAAEEDELNDDQDEDMTSELGSAEVSEGEGQLPDMDTKKIKAKGFYKEGCILRSKYRHGWRFLVKWEGRGNVGTLHSVFFGPRKREFSISGLLQCQRSAEGAKNSGDQE